MPLPFYLSCAAILIIGCHAWSARRQAWGLPACMVMATTAVWYVGDMLYNDSHAYLATIGKASVVSAWWQVLWFLIAFAALAPALHRWINGRLLGKPSHVMLYLETQRLRRPEVQHQIDLLGSALLVAWTVLMGIGLLRVKGDAIGLFAPYFGQKADPWARGQIGGGFSALISLAGYLQVFLTAAFGVLAAVAFNPRTRAMALLVCFLAMPYFIFDRTRNTMLATMIPGILAYVLFRLRGGLLTKGAVLFGCFLLINFWFTFVMANRTGQSIAAAFKEGGEGKALSETKHEGLNMLEELAWVDHFLESGAYRPNWGERYLAELANPIPRAIWKNKPTIGLDYAVARGQSASGPSGEVTATISTGMIGQGVVNFGRIGGPFAAATLMALWVALLARQDLLGSSPGRLILYGSGLILTFNMGRDITLLVLYPFLFGLGLFLSWQYYVKHAGPQASRQQGPPPGPRRGNRKRSPGLRPRT
jgi:hypothetical protein